MLRDTHTYYHLVLAVDTTQGTAANRIKVYLDGEQITAFGTETYPSQNYNCHTNNTVQHNIGASTGVNSPFNGYVSKIDFIDGTQYAASDFGHTSADTGKWVASDTSGLTFGTNGFSLDFNDDRASTPDTTTVLYDQSVNSNNWSGASLVAGSFTSDTPVDTYATANTLDKSPNITTSNGNLTVLSASSDELIRSTLPIYEDEKIYFEFTIDVLSGALSAMTGVCTGELAIGINNPHSNALTWLLNHGTGDFWNTTNASYGSGFSTTETAMCAIDRGNNAIYFGDADTDTWFASATIGEIEAGTTTNAATTSLPSTGSLFPCFADPNGSNNGITFNFGATDFKGTKPEGFKVLSSANLPAPDNWKPQDNANIVLYTGDAVATKAVTGMGFQPDFMWIKNRDSAFSHIIDDAVRGFGASGANTLATNATDQDGLGDTLTTAAQYGYVDTADSDGFTVNRGVTSPYHYSNASGADYWSLGILADNTSGSSNTDGTITSTVATDGINFSIVTYTGTGVAATVGHGLAEAPDLVIVKNTSTAGTFWRVGHSSLGFTTGVYLDLTNAAWVSNTIFNDTAPTSSVISIGTNNDVNKSGDTIVAYCFKFGDVFAGGSYIGNGSTDGTFMPSDELLMFCFKITNLARDWGIGCHPSLGMNDVNGNPVGRYIFPNLSIAEANRGTSSGTDLDIDFLSNGLKIRTIEGAANNSGSPIIWWGIKKNGGQLSA